MTDLFTLPERISLPVQGETRRFPIHRIFCVGRNYADHAAEMGMKVDREAPIYFTKSAENAVLSGQEFPYPPGTENYHYEMEFVVAIGKDGRNIATENALDHAYGFGCGLDMTRRDLQAKMRDRGYPWDVAKNVENSAVFGELTKAQDFDIADQAITLDQNGVRKQSGKLSEMIWSVPEIISDLSHLYTLRAGDVILTGTPAGVGAVAIGDQLRGEIEGLLPVTLAIGPKA